MTQIIKRPDFQDESLCNLFAIVAVGVGRVRRTKPFSERMVGNSSARARWFFDDGPAVIAHDKNGIITMVTRAALDAFGARNWSDLVGRPSFETASEENRPARDALFEKLRAEHCVAYEGWRQKLNGEPFFMKGQLFELNGFETDNVWIGDAAVFDVVSAPETIERVLV